MNFFHINIEKKLTAPRLGERHKKLNELVREISPDEISINNLKENMCEMKQIDLIFIGRLANYRKNPYIICELLKSNDSTVVSVALQSKWFFTADDNMANTKDMANVKYFQNEIFPHASYHTVCRIVSTFSACLQNEIVAQDFYNYIRELYGMKLAIKLLPKCNVNFIRTELQSALFDIPCAQIYSIYKKDKKLAVEYLEKYFKEENKSKLPLNHCLKISYRKVLVQLAKDDPMIYLELFNECLLKIVWFGLGHRTVKKVVNIMFDELVEDPDRYDTIIPKKYVIESLRGENLEKYLLSCMPWREECFKSDDNAFKNLKPEFRFKMITRLYPRKYYGKEFINRDDFECWSLAKYMSIQDRVKWARKAINKTATIEFIKQLVFCKYLEVTECIPRLQKAWYEALSWESKSSTCYLDAAIECCEINNDTKTLIRVMKHVWHRLKEHHIELLIPFICKLKDTFHLHELPSECWEIIIQVIDHLLEKKTIVKSVGSYTLITIYSDHVHHCVLNNLAITPTIDKMFNLGGGCIDVEWDLKNADCEKKLYQVIVEKYKSVLFDDVYPYFIENGGRIIVVHKLLDIFFNKKVFSSTSEFSWVTNYIVKHSNGWSNYEKVQLFLKIKKNPKLRDFFIKDIFTSICGDKKLCMNYLMFNLNIILENIKDFVKYTVMVSRPMRHKMLYKKIHSYFMQPLGQQLIEILENEKQSNGNKNDRRLAITVLYLCYLKPADEQNQLIKQFDPSNSIVDVTTDYKTESESIEIIAKYVKTLNPPVQLDTLMLFVSDYYLKFSLPAVLAYPFRITTTESRALIDALLKNGGRAKKHAVRLVYFILPRKEVLALYHVLWYILQDPTLRDVVFSFSFKLLTTEDNKQRYIETWDKVAFFMSSFVENDLSSLSYLTTPQVMMPAFVNEFCVTAWELLNFLIEENVDAFTHKIFLIENLAYCLNLLNDEFCIEFARQFLYPNTTTQAVSLSMFEFIITFLVKPKSVQSQIKIVDGVCKVFNKYITDKWNIKVNDVYRHRKVVNDFVTRCCMASFRQTLEINPIYLLRSISRMLTSVLPMASMLKMYTILDIAIYFRELLLDSRYSNSSIMESKSSATSHKFFEALGEKISIKLNNICSKYGSATSNLVLAAIEEVIRLIPDDDYDLEVEILYLIMGLLTNIVSEECFFVSVYLLPRKTSANQDLYDKIIMEIVNKSDIAIKILLNEKVDLEGSVFREY